MPPILNVDLTLFVFVCKINLGVLEVQCHKNCHLLNDFIQISTTHTMFHCKDVRMQTIIDKIPFSNLHLDEKLEVS